MIHFPAPPKRCPADDGVYETLVGMKFHALPGDLDWNGLWPVVDGTMTVVHISDGTDDDYLLADTDDTCKHLANIGKAFACEVLIKAEQRAEEE
jgi:hypothetical protein